MRRVVITGIGVVSPIGIGRNEYWDALAEGKNGIDFISAFDAADYRLNIAGEVRNFDPLLWFDKKEARHTDRTVQFAEVCARQALEEANINFTDVDPYRFGVCIGSGQGGIHTLVDSVTVLSERGEARVSPFTVPMMIVDMPSGYVAMKHNAKGPNFSVSSACATALHSIGEAYHTIVRGDADYMLSGGTEATIIPFGAASFGATKAISRNPEAKKACRPFDADRDGFVLGEGAGVIMLEEYEAAKARGAHIYAEIKGYGATCDAYHFTAPDPSGDATYTAMKLAVERADWDPKSIDLVNAHGTSTPLNDKMETEAVKRLMGEEAGSRVLVQATKSMIGHALGASGALDLIAALMAVDKSIVHQTLNYETPDPECALNVVAGKAVRADVRRVIVNAFAFGGHNAVIALEKCRD
ncbi:MAG: beta-ketoacyl-ACP synthase II [Synergistaceae bacterium]|nr:beta-ketoacyl-ACP synthase II [Candidatus Equadaptatus faecalis]